ncbi:MAG: biotin transporter BioY [Oscillospiraceae bacterium]|nr:biotin transporter BioY [Oscillospiraceae bacterium]
MKSSIYNMTASAVFVAIITICSQLAIPFPSGVSITLQTFAISLTGFCSKPLRSFVTILVYILLGAVGIPVFSGFQGGLGIITGHAGGFIAGFIPLAVLCSIASVTSKKPFKIIFSATGLILCHLMGVIYFSIYTNTSFVSSLLAVCLPYIIKDAVLIYLSYELSLRLKRHRIFR